MKIRKKIENLNLNGLVCLKYKMPFYQKPLPSPRSRKVLQWPINIFPTDMDKLAEKEMMKRRPFAKKTLGLIGELTIFPSS